MNKQTIVGGVVVLALLGSIMFYALTKPVPAQAPGAGTSAIDLPDTSYSEHAKYYDIETYYASSTPLSGAANTAAVALMKDFIARTIAQFKTDGNFENLTAADIKTMGFGEGRKETLKIVYLIGSSARTVSYVFTIYTDTLGAHGNTDFKTFTFDTTTGKVLSLADLFAPGSDYLGPLSKLAREKLPTIIGENSDAATIAGGTTPVEDNFKNFLFDNRDLLILFPPYQVAAYSEGPQTLRLPVSLLSSVLKNEYR